MRIFALAMMALLLGAPADAAVKRRRAAHHASGSVKRKGARSRAAALKAPPVSAHARSEASAAVHEVTQRAVESGGPIENSAALVPFFEQLYRLQQGEAEGGLHILHYGDSHTASDDWAHSLRVLFQQQFGNGGAGFSLAGHPYLGYRRYDVKSNSSSAWYTDGMAAQHDGDGNFGLGGMCITTTLPHQTVTLDAEGEQMELFYLQQPNGGSLQFSDNGRVVDTISTRGEPGPGYYRYLPVEPGPHRLELETTGYEPVRLFGWVAENRKGVTYETLGINGAQAPMQLHWNETIQGSNLSRRNPGLILVAYGTNEASNREVTPQNYRVSFAQVLQRLRKAAPAATILVIGPPDRWYRIAGRPGWYPYPRMDMVIDAEREVALANGCAFYDLRRRMGGPGSVTRWMTAGLAQPDHVHLTRDGYHLIGQTLYQDLIEQYRHFAELRKSWPEKLANGQQSQNPSNR